MALDYFKNGDNFHSRSLYNFHSRSLYIAGSESRRTICSWYGSSKPCGRQCFCRSYAFQCPDDVHTIARERGEKRVVQRLGGGVGLTILSPRGCHENISFQGWDRMTPHMIKSELASNPTPTTKGLAIYVPRIYLFFCAVPPELGDNFVSPPPPSPLSLDV